MEPATEGDQAAQSKRHSGFLYHAVVSILIVLVALILRAQHPGKVEIEGCYHAENWERGSAGQPEALA